jgi:hypothetical protein
MFDLYIRQILSLDANDDDTSKAWDTKFSYHIHPSYSHLPLSQQKNILDECF